MVLSFVTKILQKIIFFTKREQLQERELLINQLTIMQEEGRTEWFRAQDKLTWIRQSCYTIFFVRSLNSHAQTFFCNPTRKMTSKMFTWVWATEL